jgi:single-stranded DNA-specific DHH superfamily exonuclease
MREDAPRASAIVNPNRPGCASGQGVLAAAGVTFVLLAALNREATEHVVGDQATMMLFGLTWSHSARQVPKLSL